MNIMESTLEPEQSVDDVELDQTGKAVLDDIYCQDDPRAYFQTLKPLDYSIPGYAQPYFSALADRLSEIRDCERARIADLGCSYGINSALLKLGIPYERLVANYTDTQFADISRDQLLTRDRLLLADQPHPAPHITGIDISKPALKYATDAGYIDGSISADLESDELGTADRHKLVNTDLIISTGCIGYVGAKTIQRLLDGMGDGRPWSAHFVLRMFSFDEIEDVFSKQGYQTIRLPGLFKQRKFISDAERNEIIHKLKNLEIETSGVESSGYFYAQLHLTIPDEDMNSARDLISAWSQMSTV